MKIVLYKAFFLLIILNLYNKELVSQEITKPLTSNAFQIELANSSYTNLIEKIKNNFELSSDEEQWYKIYNEYLRKYYNLLPSEEKNKISTDKLVFINNKPIVSETEISNLPDVNSNYGVSNTKNAEVQNIFLKQIFYSGYYGMYYGLATNAIFNLKDAIAVGTPLLMSGANMLIFMTLQDRKSLMTNESLWLRAHGKFVGAFGGFALSALLFGDDFLDDGYNWSYNGYNYEKTKPDYQAASLAIAMTSSIGLGYLGVHLGETKNWDESRISLYRHFSFLNTSIGNMLAFAFNTDDLRWYGGVSLLSAASGYLIADKVADIKSYSRGDLIAAGGFTIINAGFGVGLATEFEDVKHFERLALLPTIGALTGTYLSYKMLDETHLTIQQGRRLNYAIIGSSLIGLGVALMLDFDSSTAYYTLPYLGSMLSYSLLLKHYKENKNLSLKYSKKKNVSAKLSLNPQNILVSKFVPTKINNFNSKMGVLPIINLKINFN